MRIVDRNWMQVEAYLAREDRIVLPVGSTEQHAYLSPPRRDPAREPLEAWAAKRAGARFRFHSWWDSPAVRAAGAEVHTGEATHASWFENFPWTRLVDVEQPGVDKPMVTDLEALRELEPAAVRAAIGDGSYGGPYQVPDEGVMRVWAAGVAEVRTLIERL